MCVHVYFMLFPEKSSLDALFKWNNGVVNGSLVEFEDLREDLRWLYVLERTRRLSVASSGVA